MANRITTLFDFKEQGSGLKKIKSDIQGVDGAWNKAKVGFKSSINEFRSSNAAQAGAIAGLAAGAGQAISLASDLEESINAVTVTYGENAEAVLAIGENSAKSFGLSKSEFNGFAVQFSAFAKQVAEKDGRQVSEVLNEMTTRVADFASVMNLDLNTAAQVFMSTMAGETEPIRRFGKDVSAATVEAYALSKGLIESKSEMTEAIKVQARYGLLMEQTADVQGDFANTSDSLANSQRILAAEAKDLGAELGTTLGPALAVVVSGLTDMLGVLDKLKVTDAISLSWVEPLGKTIGQFFGDLAFGADGRKANEAIVNAFNDAEKAAAEFDHTLLANVTTFDEARKIALKYAENVEGLEDAQHAANVIALEWLDTTGKSIEEQKAAEEAARLYADSLRENAREATYNADANEEMGRIQAQVTRVVDKAREAQERFLQSIKFTRDEVGHLKREIDDRQAWLNLQDTFDATTAKMEDQEATAREQEQAILSLKEEVLDYAESINLPDKVTTQLVALIDRGQANEVQALLERWGNGVTVPLRLQVVNSVNAALASRGVTARVTPEGNLRRRAHGGPTSAGEMYEVTEGGKSELLHEGGKTYLMAGKDGRVEPITSGAGASSGSGGGGVVIGELHIHSNANNGDEFAREVRKAIEREMRWNGNVSGWRGQ